MIRVCASVPSINQVSHVGVSIHRSVLLEWGGRSDLLPCSCQLAFPSLNPLSGAVCVETHLPGEGWTFVDAIVQVRQLQAAEYLRLTACFAMTRSDGVVVDIEAGLLLRRADQSEWTAKVIPMRAVCDAGRMDRQDSSREAGVLIPVDLIRPLRSRGCARSHDPSEHLSMRRPNDSANH